MEIKIISAGAGSGKTYSLTGEMTALLKNGVRPAAIVATTFTKKAAAELQERVRVRLLEAGLFEQANELGEAMIGTVNSLGLRLLQRFAFEAGVSPLVETMADEDAQLMFNQSLSQVILPERIEQMNLLSDRLGLTQKSFGDDEYDWRKDIRTITDLARANDFSIEVLEKSRDRSLDGLLRFFQNEEEEREPRPADFNWNAELKRALIETISALESNEKDDTKTTRTAVEDLRNFQNQLNWRGELFWGEWVKISKLKVATKSADLFEPLRQLARDHDQNSLFLADIQSFTKTIFDTAIDALQEFAAYKRKRGLIDYIDMEALVNRLLDRPTVQETLRGELDLLLVDEFQDTSPIQLSIFLKMSRLAKHSIWVGDPKQSIYGFRGAEPALMAAVVEKSGGIRPENILRHSWRSVPDLVHAANAIFTRAFSDLPAEQVALEPKRPPVAQPTVDFDEQKPLIHWHFLNELDERKTPGKPWFENCIASQLAVWLERNPLVLPKGEKEPRPARPGDVAILCRSNQACIEVAEALHRAGLKAAIARAGLLDTTEAKLVLACLKFALNSHDALAIAEILVLAEGSPLEAVIEDRLLFLEKQTGGDELEAAISGQKFYGKWASESFFIQKINDLRARTAELSSAEILDFLLDELDLRRLVATWGNAAQRLDNVDIMRRMALRYEENCHRLHAGASLGGFLLYLKDLDKNKKDNQASGESPDAVRVMTYHASKGLEFPVTVLYSLEGKLRGSVWGAALVRETPDVSLDDILGTRWLRFWVNPYGQQLGGTRLEEAVEASPEHAEARRAALAEEARLLYVGLTRARDFLVFPTTMRPTLWLNRTFHHGIEDRPTLDSEGTETSFEWAGRILEKTTETAYFGKEFGEKAGEEPPFTFPAEPFGRGNFRPLRIDPATDLPYGWQPKIGQPNFWGSPILWKKTPDDSGPGIKVLLEFLLADNPNFSETTRLAMADRLIKLHGCRENLAAEMLVAQLDSWWAYLPFFDPKNQLARAVPVRRHFEKRLFEGRADLLFEVGGELQIFLLGGPTMGGKLTRQRVGERAGELYFLQKSLEKERFSLKTRAFVLFAADGFWVEVGV